MIQAELSGNLCVERAEVVAKSTGGQCDDDPAESMLGTAYQ